MQCASWEKSWLITDQRIIIVFDNPIAFDEIVLNNTHTSGVQTDTGIKDIKIHGSTDTITNTTYDSVISNSMLLFDGQITMHNASNAADDFVVYSN